MKNKGRKAFNFHLMNADEIDRLSHLLKKKKTASVNII